MSVDRPELDRVLSCSTLPTLPSVGLQVLQLTRNPNVSAEQIAKVIETDPALSAKVLKTVNSSLYSLKDPCTTIRRSLGYLGLAAVKSLVLGFSLMDSTKNMGDAGAQGMDEYWRRTIYAACGARAILERFEDNGVAVRRVVAIGGIARKSPLVMQVCADVMQRPIAIVRSDQCCALGAAIAGAVAAGIHRDVTSAQRAMASRVERVVRPNRRAAKAYDALYAQYHALGAAQR